MPIPKPTYTIWQAISAALALATRALNEVRALARMPGPPGEKGEKGEPGLGFDDMSFDGERRVTWKRFDQSFEIVMPYPIERGPWKHDQAYERGDLVTSDGSWWSAQDTSINERPGTNLKAWRLSVKRGRDASRSRDA